METNKFIYLENYLEKEFIIVDNNNSKTEFANSIKINSLDILSNSEELKKGDFVLINNKHSFIYVVKPKDTIESIGLKFNVNCDEIKRKNGIKTIFIGQQLNI